MASEATGTSSSGNDSPEETEISQTTRSCRGCLYYSSIMREQGRNPICLGLSRSSELQMNHHEVDNDVAKNFRNFADFKYACIGYSYHKELSSNQTTQPIDDPGELPDCVGLVFLADGSIKPARQPIPNETAPSPNTPPPKPLDRPHREDGPTIMPRPPSSTGSLGSGGGVSADEFATRFFRTSRLVASAVANNVGRVANNVRATVDKIFTSDQGRPKA